MLTLSNSVIELANEFQQSIPGLDVNTTDAAIAHDAIHAMTGWGVSLEEEELVLNLTNLIQNGTCTKKLEERVTNMLSLISEFPFFIEVTNYLTSQLA